MLRRIINLRKAMKKLKIGAFFATNPVSVFYLTGISASAGAVLVTNSATILFLDKRYSEMASERSKVHYVVKDSSEMVPLLQGLPGFGFEADSVSVEQYERWKTLFKNKKLVQVNGLIKGLRRIKDATELSKIRRACTITKDVLQRIPTLVKNGMSEKQLADIIETECLKLGAEGMAFDSIVAFGDHTSRPHHRPTDRKYSKGDVIQIDMGAKYDGYCSDYSRFFIGASEDRRIHNAVRALRKAKKEAERLIAHGVSLHALDRAARSVLALYGYDEEFCHALGHGLGLEIHEGVTISTKRPDDTLREGDVITIEPGLYFPGLFGVRIEDTHIVGRQRKR